MRQLRTVMLAGVATGVRLAEGVPCRRLVGDLPLHVGTWPAFLFVCHRVQGCSVSAHKPLRRRPPRGSRACGQGGPHSGHPHRPPLPAPPRVPFPACPIGLTARNVRRANPAGAALLPTPPPPAPDTHVTAAAAATASATPPPSSPGCRCRRRRRLRSLTALGAAAGADDLVSAAASRRPVRGRTCSRTGRGRQVHSLRTRLSRAENSLASTNGVPRDDAPHLEQRLQAPRIHLS